MYDKMERELLSPAESLFHKDIAVRLSPMFYRVDLSTIIKSYFGTDTKRNKPHTPPPSASASNFLNLAFVNGE